MPDQTHTAINTPTDTYQQARLALRERMGLEPTPALVVQIQSIIENHGVDGETAVFRHLNHVAKDDAASDQDRALAEAFLRTYRTQETELWHARDKVQQLDAKVAELRNMGERDREELRRLHPFEGEAKELRRVIDHPFFHSIVVDEDNSLVDNILDYLDERTQATTAAPEKATPPEQEAPDYAVVVPFRRAEPTAGLARLRAHAALDNLLDQHGISR